MDDPRVDLLEDAFDPVPMRTLMGGADFSKGLIYEISSKRGNVRYIGSTTEPLDRRIARHLSMFKSHKAGNGPYVHSFKVLKHGDAVIRLYRRAPGRTKHHLEKVEGRIQRRLRRLAFCLDTGSSIATLPTAVDRSCSTMHLTHNRWLCGQ